MKRLTPLHIACVCLLALLAASLFVRQGSTAEAQAAPPRFQLFQGSYKITIDKDSSQESGVFRIDTQTGTTWTYTTGFVAGKYVERWDKIAEQ